MATKTQATAACLLLSLMFCTFASGQLLDPVLTCLSQTLQLLTCGTVLNLIKIDGVTDVLNSACCSLFATLTPQQAAKCLCLAVKANLLGLNLNVSIPGDINLLLNACGKSVSLLGC